MRLLDLKSKVFVDKHHRNIYYLPKSKEAFIIKDDNLKGFNIFHKRYFISFVCMGGLYFFTPLNHWWAFISGLVILTVLTLILKKVILPSYTKIVPYNPAKERQLLNADDPRIGRLVGIMLAAIVFIVAILFFKLPDDQLIFLILVGLYLFIDALYSLMDQTQFEISE